MFASDPIIAGTIGAPPAGSCGGDDGVDSGTVTLDIISASPGLICAIESVVGCSLREGEERDETNRPSEKSAMLIDQPIMLRTRKQEPSHLKYPTSQHQRQAS